MNKRKITFKKRKYLEHSYQYGRMFVMDVLRNSTGPILTIYPDRYVVEHSDGTVYEKSIHKEELK